MGGINKLQMANNCSLMFMVGFPSLTLTFRSSPQGTFKATTVSDPKGCPGVDTGVTWKFSGYQRGKWSSNMSKTSLGLPFQNITKCAKQIWKSSWIMILIPVSGMEKRLKKNEKSLKLPTGASRWGPRHPSAWSRCKCLTGDWKISCFFCRCSLDGSKWIQSFT